MHIRWQIKKGNPYGYLREVYWDKEKKAVRTRAVYLGTTLAEAERKLDEYLTSGKVALPALEQRKLLEQLRETAPEQALKPKRDIPLESTIRLLTRQRDKYKDTRPDIAKPLEAAIKALEKLKEG
ncbi:hypothetical protein IT084_14595 [Desulfallas sp. Bu1-1]|uniref:hypothetical protein n=1 Tax=Desulfallas sp. Bu1-1 TaxID=2787620 RepID=UPI00189F4078|nr:hypothetical protein [Desulfallas sp. Bu1-1]MBF7084191.1 hypothetical protein [Desulfallas sp. Bu1-1]